MAWLKKGGNLRILLRAMVLLLVSMVSTAAHAESTRIVAGERIGPVVLGMAESDLMRLLGGPDKTHETVGTVNRARFVFSKDYYYGAERLGGHVWEIGVSSIPVPQIKNIKTTSAKYATSHGVKVGSSGIKVVEAFGGQYKTNYLSGPMAGGVQLLYDQLGIGFILTQDNRVVAIQVWPRR